MLDVIHRSISLTKNAGGPKNSNVVTDDAPNAAEKSINDLGSMLNLERALVKAGSDCLESARKQKCSICGPARVLPDDSCNPFEEESSGDGDGGGGEGESLAIVPVQKLESPSTSITLMIGQLPEAKPGWPLLRHAVLSEPQAPDRSSLRKISVVQWALRLPSRQPSLVTDSDHKQSGIPQGDAESPGLDGESGAIVPVGNEIVSTSPSHRNSAELPKELEGLHEKYSATCRPFKYQELLSATSNFLAGMFGSSNYCLEFMFVHFVGPFSSKIFIVDSREFDRKRREQSGL